MPCKTFLLQLRSPRRPLPNVGPLDGMWYSNASYAIFHWVSSTKVVINKATRRRRRNKKLELFLSFRKPPTTTPLHPLDYNSDRIEIWARMSREGERRVWTLTLYHHTEMRKKEKQNHVVVFFIFFLLEPRPIQLIRPLIDLTDRPESFPWGYRSLSPTLCSLVFSFSFFLKRWTNDECLLAYLLASWWIVSYSFFLFLKPQCPIKT